jgi:ABC-type transport system involved in cytochrome bd biosynthesis fused ATPase/permease subunit
MYSTSLTVLGDKDHSLMKSAVEFLTRSSSLFFSYVRGLETIDVFEEKLNVEAEIQKSIETFTTFTSTTE